MPLIFRSPELAHSSILHILQAPHFSMRRLKRDGFFFRLSAEHARYSEATSKLLKICQRQNFNLEKHREKYYALVSNQDMQNFVEFKSNFVSLS